MPYIALEEIGAPFDLEMLNIWNGDYSSPEFRALNPRGIVPVVEIDGWVISENPVVPRVLASSFPEAKLLPTGDAKTEFKAQEMLAWFASGVHAAAGRQMFPQFFTISEDERQWENIRLAARWQLAEYFKLLEQQLADREYLFRAWSIVDVYMLYLWWRAVGAGTDPTPFPRCAKHGARIEARPSVATVLDREEAELARMKVEVPVPHLGPARYPAPTNVPPGYVGRSTGLSTLLTGLRASNEGSGAPGRVVSCVDGDRNVDCNAQPTLGLRVLGAGEAISWIDAHLPRQRPGRAPFFYRGLTCRACCSGAVKTGLTRALLG